MSNMQLRLTCCGVAVCGMCSLADSAQAQSTRGMRDFIALDVNNDGRVSREEWKVKEENRRLAPKEARDRFLAIDTNDDNFISHDEMSDWLNRKNKKQRKNEKNRQRERAELEEQLRKQQSESQKSKPGAKAPAKK